MCFSHWVPEVRGPAGKGIGETFGSIGTGDLRQKGFGVAIPIGARSSGEQRQAIGGIAAQIPGARHSNRSQKQEREQQASADCCTACQGKTRWG
jgi:hypothetical protein